MTGDIVYLIAKPETSYEIKLDTKIKIRDQGYGSKQQHIPGIITKIQLTYCIQICLVRLSLAVVSSGQSVFSLKPAFFDWTTISFVLSPSVTESSSISSGSSSGDRNKKIDGTIMIAVIKATQKNESLTEMLANAAPQMENKVAHTPKMSQKYQLPMPAYVFLCTILPLSIKLIRQE